MHTPSLHKWHMFDQSLTFFEHHQIFTMLLLLVILFGVLHGAALQLEGGRVSQTMGSPEISGREFLEVLRPLTRMMDPQYAHEYFIREQYITDELERLQRFTLADRAYVVIYNAAFSSSGTGIGPHISNFFEVTGEKIPPKLKAFQGTSRQLWLQLKQDEQTKNELFAHLPKSSGREIYDEHNMAIGYIGLEKLHGDVLLPHKDSRILREAAEMIRNGLIHPLESI